LPVGLKESAIMTPAAMQSILNSITVIIDSREHEGKHDHIISYFGSKNIKYVYKKLDFADYSFTCPAVPEYGLPEELNFEKKIVVERKFGLSELCGNILNRKDVEGKRSDERDRLEREFQRAKETGAKFNIMVEDGSFDKILTHQYRSETDPKSFYATLFAFDARYGAYVQFVEKKNAGWFIYNKFRYFLREELKKVEAPTRRS
jgi:hypothetical protein